MHSLHTYICTHKTMYFLLKCVLKQGKAEKVWAIVKHMDAKPQAYKQTEITVAFLGLSSVLSTA